MSTEGSRNTMLADSGPVISPLTVTLPSITTASVEVCPTT